MMIDPCQEDKQGFEEWAKNRPTSLKTGKLKYKFSKPIGHSIRYDHFECVDCGTLYPEMPTDVNGVIENKIRCNGHVIELCPWCRPDSRPWKAGRGA